MIYQQGEKMSIEDNNAGLETKDIEIAVSESDNHIYIEAWIKMSNGERKYHFGQSIEKKAIK